MLSHLLIDEVYGAVLEQGDLECEGSIIDMVVVVYLVPLNREAIVCVCVEWSGVTSMHNYA